MTALHSAVGILGLLALAWLFSEQRRAVDWRVPVGGLLAQLLLAVLLLKVPASRHFFEALNDMVVALQTATEAGTSFVFGYLGGGPLPFEQTRTGGSLILAFRALPLDPDSLRAASVFKSLRHRLPQVDLTRLYAR